LTEPSHSRRHELQRYARLPRNRIQKGQNTIENAVITEVRGLQREASFAAVSKSLSVTDRIVAHSTKEIHDTPTRKRKRDPSPASSDLSDLTDIVDEQAPIPKASKCSKTVILSTNRTNVYASYE
jgi:hypothetical protein